MSGVFHGCRHCTQLLRWQILLNPLVLRVLMIDPTQYDDCYDEVKGGAEVTPSVQQSTTEDTATMVLDNLRHEARLEWRRLAAVIDRICLLVFLTVSVILCLIFSRYL